MLNIDKLESLIKEKGWSNTYFCKIMGHSKVWISDWKRGKGLPDENTLKAIADKLNTTVDYLTDKTDQKDDPEHWENEQTVRIAKLFREKGLPFNEETVNLFLDVVAANAEIIKKQIERNK